MDSQKEYYLGLDCGTGSVGWAVTDLSYNLLKFKGKYMWGSRLFENANTAKDRRINRCARRRYARSKERIKLLDELLKSEIELIDKDFIQRVKDSAYFASDKSEVQKNSLFNDKDYKDKDFFKAYPTIFHLRKALIEGTAEHDVRFLYLALHHILKNRGHFLFTGGDSLSAVQNIEPLLTELADCSTDVFNSSIFFTDKQKAIAIIKDYKGSARIKNLSEITVADDDKIKKYVLKLLAGNKVNASDLFDNEELKSDDKDIGIEYKKDSFDSDMLKLEELLEPEQYHFIETCKAIYDWSLLSQIMNGEAYISIAKVKQFEVNKEDLKDLKYLFSTYLTEKEYDAFFHTDNEKAGFFSNYIGQLNDHRTHKSVRRTSIDDFYKAIKNSFKNMDSIKEDIVYQRVISKIDEGTFLNLLISSKNSRIPYQVNFAELDKILESASVWLPLLNKEDENGFTVKSKIRSIMKFRIPYYVGPLVDESKSEFSWMVRKEEGKIYPWNFDKKVDVSKSAEKFILRMLNDCTYLPGEKVLPKNSLLYSEFMVRNELNNLKINGEKLSVEQNNLIYEKLFKEYNKVTQKRLISFVKSEGWFSCNDELRIEGIDGDFKSSLASYRIFKGFLDSNKLTLDNVENIIKYLAIFEDGGDILDEKISKEVGDKLSSFEIAVIKKLNMKGWGRLSKKFLVGIEGTDLATGEIHSILYFLRNTNHNLMELLSCNYDFTSIIDNEKIKTVKKLDYSIVENLSVSPSVKRQIWQTLKVVKEIHKVMGCAPKKLFIEFAREEQKKDRVKSRKETLVELYESIKNPTQEDIDLKKGLMELSEVQIAKNDRLYLYYTQKGRCMYSGKKINIDDLFNVNIYDVDHIIPQAKIKDDSLTNRVLVFKTINGEKGDKYPLSDTIQNNQKNFWNYLLNLGLIKKEKYNRLVRIKPLSENELTDFINRQLVETRQSTKACASILKSFFGSNTKIVYSKARNVSDFKNEYEIPKVRIVNDLHHAKDAYLNIVVGNCYDTKFSNPRFIQTKEQYNLSKIFRYDIKNAWDKNETIKVVKRNLANNQILFTRQTFCRTGQLFDLMPLKGGEKQGMIPRKISDSKLQAQLENAEDKDKCINDWITKYGGYNSLAISYFIIVQYTVENNRIISMVGIPVKDCKILNNKEDLKKYCINELKLNNPKILFSKVPINATFEFNDYRVSIAAKNGATIILKNATSFYMSVEEESYLKSIENVINAKKRNAKDFLFDESLYGIAFEKNLNLYNSLTDKANLPLFLNRNKKLGDILKKKKEKFINLSLENQVQLIYELICYFNTSSIVPNLSLIDESKNFGILTFNANFNLKKYSYVIVNQSITGLFENSIRIG